MTRRGFLRRLGLAPVAIPLAVQAMATAPSLAERARAWYRLVSAHATSAGIAIGRRWAASEHVAYTGRLGVWRGVVLHKTFEFDYGRRDGKLGV